MYDMLCYGRVMPVMIRLLHCRTFVAAATEVLRAGYYVICLSGLFQPLCHSADPSVAGQWQFPYKVSRWVVSKLKGKLVLILHPFLFMLLFALYDVHAYVVNCDVLNY